MSVPSLFEKSKVPPQQYFCHFLKLKMFYTNDNINCISQVQLFNSVTKVILYESPFRPNKKKKKSWFALINHNYDIFIM